MLTELEGELRDSAIADTHKEKLAAQRCIALIDARMPVFGNVWSRIRHEAVAIRHTNEWECASVDNLPFADDLVEVQKVCGQRINLLWRQCARILVRHRTVDVVPHRGGVRPKTSDR
jgi:hypothetical protein